MPPREKPEKPGKQARSESRGAPEGDQLVAMARGLAEIAAEHGLSELILDTKDVTLTVRRGGVPVAAVPAPVMIAHAPAVVGPISPLPSAASVQAAPPPPRVEDKSHVVTSPFVGTFYGRPNPDSPPYVTLGTRVERGQVLCIVEAMKLMNEIEADAAGTIAEILVKDAQPVEYGQPLFKIAP
jgi:acetyl-CoA carboxylase biotin carboxyl carrier protein